MKIAEVNDLLPRGAKLTLALREHLMMGCQCVYSDPHRRHMSTCLWHIGEFIKALDVNGFTISKKESVTVTEAVTALDNLIESLSDIEDLEHEYFGCEHPPSCALCTARDVSRRAKEEAQ